MNYFGGGERHNYGTERAYFHSASDTTEGPHSLLPGLSLVRERPGDERGFIHQKIFGGLKGVVGGFISGGPLGALKGGLGGFFGGGSRAVPQASQCPPGFFASASGCVPVATPDFRLTGPLSGRPLVAGVQEPDPRVVNGRRGSQRLPFGRPESRVPGVTGEAVLGQFGAGTEPEVFDTMVRRCPRKSVLGADGICYNRGDLRNSDRWWPRGRRPLLTGGDMRAISTASSAAKKLQRKQKQLQMLGLLKKPAARSRPQLPAGHRAELRHAGSGHE